MTVTMPGQPTLLPVTTETGLWKRFKKPLNWLAQAEHLYWNRAKQEEQEKKGKKSSSKLLKGNGKMIITTTIITKKKVSAWRQFTAALPGLPWVHVSEINIPVTKNLYEETRINSNSYCNNSLLTDFCTRSSSPNISATDLDLETAKWEFLGYHWNVRHNKIEKLTYLTPLER